MDLYYLYGLSLLENAIVSNSVLGKTEEQPAEEEEEPGKQRQWLDVFCVSLRTMVLTQVTLCLDIASKAGNASGEARFVFGADGGDDEPLDLLAQAEAMFKADDEKTAASGKEVAENGGAGEEEEEPEDDFNAAWEILDLARKTYESMDGDVNRLKLAHTYMALGDVSLETGEPAISNKRYCISGTSTEKFDQAILDMTSALDIRAQHLPLSSRDIADCHFRLSMAYDMTVGQLEKQIEHVERALASVRAREEDLTEALPNAPESKPVEPPAADPKGKGKATTSGEAAEDPLNWLPKDDKVTNMTKGQIESELRDVKAVREDLQAKVWGLNIFLTFRRLTCKCSWKISRRLLPTVLVEQLWIASKEN